MSGIAAVALTVAMAAYYVPLLLGDTEDTEEHQARLVVETDGAIQPGGFEWEPHINTVLDESGELKVAVQIFPVWNLAWSKASTQWPKFDSSIRLFIFNGSDHDRASPTFTVSCNPAATTTWIRNAATLPNGNGGMGRMFSRYSKNGADRHWSGFLVESPIAIGKTIASSVQGLPGAPFNRPLTEIGGLDFQPKGLVEASLDAGDIVVCSVHGIPGTHISRPLVGRRIDRAQYSSPTVIWSRRNMRGDHPGATCEVDISGPYCWREPTGNDLNTPTARIRSELSLRKEASVFTIEASSGDFQPGGPNWFIARSTMSETTQFCTDYACMQESRTSVLVKRAGLDSLRNVQWFMLGLLLPLVYVLSRRPIRYIGHRILNEST